MNTLTMIRILMAGCWFIAPIYYLSQSTTRGGMDAEMDDGDTARRGVARHPAGSHSVRRWNATPIAEPHSIYIGRGLYARHMGRG